MANSFARQMVTRLAERKPMQRAERQARIQGIRGHIGEHAFSILAM
jgi:hypothetical protein